MIRVLCLPAGPAASVVVKTSQSHLYQLSVSFVGGIGLGDISQWLGFRCSIIPVNPA